MATSTAPRRRSSTAAAPAAAAEWAAVSRAGLCTVEELGKHELMRRTGLPARDLRALASPSSCPSSTVTARDRALVVSLDRARAVVTAAEVLLPGPRDPAVAPLVRDLRARLETGAASPAPTPQDDGQGKQEYGREVENGKKVLPFEFSALEVCLEFACNCLQHEVRAAAAVSMVLQGSVVLKLRCTSVRN